jgi:hypothetical protein
MGINRDEVVVDTHKKSSLKRVVCDWFILRNRTVTFTNIKEQAACQTSVCYEKGVFLIDFGADGGDRGKFCVGVVKIAGLPLTLTLTLMLKSKAIIG